MHVHCRLFSFNWFPLQLAAGALCKQWESSMPKCYLLHCMHFSETDWVLIVALHLQWPELN